MRQRVIIARAMMHEPALLFLDEPTASLDPVNIHDVHQALRRLNQSGTTIFLTTHNMHEAETLCDRIAFLHDGKITALDTPHNLRVQYGNRSITLHLKDGSTQTVSYTETGAQAIYDSIKSGSLQTIHSNEPTLGDIFVQLTGRELQ